MLNFFLSKILPTIFFGLLFFSPCLISQTEVKKQNFDSLSEFPLLQIQQQLDQAGVSGKEAANYIAVRKRQYILEKYFPKPILSKKELSQGPASIQTSTCNYSDFENITSGSYTTANAIPGWSVSSSNILSACSPTAWIPGSSEFSVLATPIMNFPILGNVPPSPLGGSQVLQLNDFSPTAKATRIQKRLYTGPSNNTVRIAYTGIWENGSHQCCEQPKFEILLRDTVFGQIISCQTVSVTGTPTSCYTGTVAPGYFSPNMYTYKTWEVVDLDLSLWNGPLLLEIRNSDCIFQGHFSSVLVDVWCGDIFTPNGYDPNHTYSNCSTNSTTILYGIQGSTTYSWTAPSYVPPIPASQATLVNVVVSNLPPIPLTYSLNFTTPVGCQFIYTVTVTPNFTTPITANVVSVPSCAQGASGTASVFAWGSTQGYLYNWKNSLNQTVSTGSVANNLAPGVYTVSVTSPSTTACGTAIVTTTILTQNPPTNYSVVPYCSGPGSFQGPSGNNYQWYLGGAAVSGTMGGNVQGWTGTFPPTAAVQLTLTNIQGCRDSIVYSFVPAYPATLQLFADTVCPNSPATLTISMTTASIYPNGTYSYSVNTGAPLNFSTSGLSSSNAFTVTIPDPLYMYNVSITTGNCLYTDTIAIGLKTPAFDFSIAPLQPTICAGESFSPVVVLSQSTAPAYSFSWTASIPVLNADSINPVFSPVVLPGQTQTFTISTQITPTNVNCPLNKTLSLTAVNLIPAVIQTIPDLCQNSPNYLISTSQAGGIFQTNAISTNPPVTLSGIIVPPNAQVGLNTFTYTIKTGSCEAATVGTFVVNPLPQFTLSARDTICIGESVVITANGNYSFIWSGMQTGQTMTVSPSVSTWYSATATDTSSNCTNNKSKLISVLPCLGFTSYALSHLSIFPNPANNLVRIDAGSGFSYELMNANGQVVLYGSSREATFDLDISKVEPGFYFIRVKTGNGNFVDRIVKQN